METRTGKERGCGKGGSKDFTVEKEGRSRSQLDSKGIGNGDDDAEEG